MLMEALKKLQQFLAGIVASLYVATGKEHISLNTSCILFVLIEYWLYEDFGLFFRLNELILLLVSRSLQYDDFIGLLIFESDLCNGFLILINVERIDIPFSSLINLFIVSSF